MLELIMIPRRSSVENKCDIVNINKAFRKIKLKKSSMIESFIKEIDNGELIDSVSFKDRFGIKLETEELSTGCKAAIVLDNNPQSIVSLIECGDNALISILKHCNMGKAIIYDRISMFDALNPYSIQIDVKLDKYRFSNLGRLNYYITDEQGYEVDMSKEGIQIV